MTATRTEGGATTGFARIELVDNWHKDWEKAMRAVEEHGDRSTLHVDSDGWLSARQNLLVAFVGEDPAAHVCFHVEPAPVAPVAHAAPQGKATRGCVEAVLDSYGIDPRYCGQGIEHHLRKAALDRAHTLKCRKLHGFDLKEQWC